MAADQQLKVVVHAVSTVVPTHKASPFFHFFSNIDLSFSWIKSYLQLATYFRSSVAPADVNGLMQSLKDSLARTLDVFPMLAGRLSRDDQTGRLQVHVNGAGIPFFQASVNARLDELQQVAYSPLEEQLNPSAIFVTDFLTVPLCRVQVTVFDCGGVAIGFSSIHVAFDGLGAVEFLKAWGEIHRGLGVSMPPNFSTELLRARDPPAVTIPMPEFITSLFEESLTARANPPAEGDFHMHPSGFFPATKNILLNLPADKVGECVKEVEAGAFSYGRASSFEAVTALIWTSMTRARSPPEEEFTNYTFPVSIRGEGRWHPPLPRGYFGNAVVNAVATARVGEILSHDISFAAQQIHKILQQITPEFVRSAIDWMELQMQEGLSVGRVMKLDPYSVMSTSFANFPISSVDFGFGKLLHLGQTINPVMAMIGASQLLPADEGGDRRSKQVALGLPEATMRKLLDDEVFVGYFGK